MAPASFAVVLAIVGALVAPQVNAPAFAGAGAGALIGIAAGFWVRRSYAQSRAKEEAATAAKLSQLRQEYEVWLGHLRDGDVDQAKAILERNPRFIRNDFCIQFARRVHVQTPFAAALACSNPSRMMSTLLELGASRDSLLRYLESTGTLDFASGASVVQELSEALETRKNQRERLSHDLKSEPLCELAQKLIPQDRIIAAGLATWSSAGDKLENVMGNAATRLATSGYVGGKHKVASAGLVAVGEAALHCIKLGQVVGQAPQSGAVGMLLEAGHDYFIDGPFELSGTPDVPLRSDQCLSLDLSVLRQQYLVRLKADSDSTRLYIRDVRRGYPNLCFPTRLRPGNDAARGVIDQLRANGRVARVAYNLILSGTDMFTESVHVDSNDAVEATAFLGPEATRPAAVTAAF